eukprot:scaffold307482_cov15-Tisochrysis_lutea.AAC.1
MFFHVRAVTVQGNKRYLRADTEYQLLTPLPPPKLPPGGMGGLGGPGAGGGGSPKGGDTPDALV